MYDVSLIAGVVPWILTSVAFVLLILWFLTKNRKLVDLIFLLILSACFVLSALMLALSAIEKKTLIYPFGGWPPPLGIVYYVDLVGALIIFFSSFLLLVIGVYASWYVGLESSRDRESVLFYVLFLGLSAGLLGCIHTGDLFNLFVMIEVTAIAAYALVAFHKERSEAIEATLKYAILGALATTLFFISVITIYASYGSLNMADIALKSRDPSFRTYFTEIYGALALASSIALSLAVWSFTFKSALAPNHFWLIDAHSEAPAPVSAALSGLIVNIGVYATARIALTVLGEGSVVDDLGLLSALGIIFTASGTLSAMLGALMMIVQKDCKRLLAYSTISHIGLMYMSLGFACISEERTRELSLAALLFHMISHSLGKTLTFLAIGVVEKIRNTRDLDQLIGVGREVPLVGLSVAIGSLSLLGVPPTVGFFSKLMMYNVFIEGGLSVLAVMLIVASAVSAMGYFKLILIVLSKPLLSVKSQRLAIDLRPALALTIISVLILVMPLLLLFGFDELLIEAARGVVDPETYTLPFRLYLEDYLKKLTSRG
ncbi:MAG: proton-conducting transporter membrane subunit [Acidilobaceae archaeon]